MSNNKVTLGKLFAQQFGNFPPDDQDKILDFIEHYQSYGFSGLCGKNVPSTRIPPETDNFEELYSFAQFYALWHYHIGIPTYETSYFEQYLTSEWLLHYRRMQRTEIRLVDLSYHPPFRMPTEEYML
ncbi:hypothetical protein LG272_10970 [Pseudidiomarina marina]|uniref:hypothetical protein n=1 Tax=Pseudidiomarina marina TaxID=502366 RepID=UPI00384AD9A5